MQEVLNKIEEILKTDAIIDLCGSTVDNRINLIKYEVNNVKDKDDLFYEKLIELISKYYSKISNKKIVNGIRIGFDNYGNKVERNYIKYDLTDMLLKTRNIICSKELFDYVCELLKKNKDIKLDYEILKKLLTDDLNYCNYHQLVKILYKNKTLMKSEITVEQIYQLLIDTYQISNCLVVPFLISKDDFKKNHEKIDEFLLDCNGEMFAKVISIIKISFDSNYDWLSLLKNAESKVIPEEVIIELINIPESSSDILKILNDSHFEINYNYISNDGIELINLLALTNDRLLIKNLLSKDENLRKTYSNGYSKINLYHLYALTGQYDQALASFENNYSDSNNKLDTIGYIRSLESISNLYRLIVLLCDSFTEYKIDYYEKLNIIFRILDNKNIKYIDINILKFIENENVLKDDDYKTLVKNIINRYKDGYIKFTDFEFDDKDNLNNNTYIIRILPEEEVKNYFKDFEFENNIVYKKRKKENR